MDIEQLRREIRPRLEAAFGDRLEGIILFGSRARGDAGDESDVDLFVLLRPPVKGGRDSDTIIRALYPFQLSMDPIVPLHAIPVDAEIFRRGEYAIYRNARAEGIEL